MAGGIHKAAEKYLQEESIQRTLERRDGMEYSRTSPGWTNKTKGRGREGEPTSSHADLCPDLILSELLR